MSFFVGAIVSARLLRLGLGWLAHEVARDLKTLAARTSIPTPTEATR